MIVRVRLSTFVRKTTTFFGHVDASPTSGRLLARVQPLVAFNNHEQMIILNNYHL